MICKFKMLKMLKIYHKMMIDWMILKKFIVITKLKKKKRNIVKKEDNKVKLFLKILIQGLIEMKIAIVFK